MFGHMHALGPNAHDELRWLRSRQLWHTEVLRQYPQTLEGAVLWVAQPWFYNVTVVPGPAWGLSGHDQQNFHDEHRFPLLGLTSEPEEDDLEAWAWHPLDVAVSGEPEARLDGGWSPCRTLVCSWGVQEAMFYKADERPDWDNGLGHQYDLACDLKMLVADRMDQDFSRMLMLHHRFLDMVRRVMNHNMHDVRPGGLGRVVRVQDRINDFCNQEELLVAQVRRHFVECLAAMAEIQEAAQRDENQP